MATTDVLRKQVKKYIDEADDKTVKMVYAMLEASANDDWWDNLPEHVQNNIDESIRQADNGALVPHEQVMKKYEKWLTK